MATILEQVKERRNLKHAEIGQILETAGNEERGLLASENRTITKLTADRANLDERIAQLETEAKREAAAAEVRRTVMGGSTNDGTRGGTYHDGREGPSFFGDLINARSGNGDAIDRLRTNNNEVRTGTPLGSYTVGSGDSFAPPVWLSQYVEVARGAGVFSSIVHQEPLPQHVSSVNLPRVRTGTEVGTQPTQHTPIFETEATTNLLTSAVSTTAGMAVVSQQMLDQAPVYSGQTFDQIILKDLAADYVQKLDQQVLWGSGVQGQLKGYLTYVNANTAACNVTTWTTSSPSPEGLFGQIGSTISDINMSRFAAPDAIVLSPRRWSSLASAVDGSGRPYVNATGGSGFNSLAQASAVVAAGQVGTIQGVPVWTDVNVPIDANGTEDVVLVTRLDDIWLWQSPVQADISPQPYASDLSVMLRLYSYSGLIVNRYPKSLGLITGTGLVPWAYQSDAVTP